MACNICTYVVANVCCLNIGSAVDPSLVICNLDYPE